MPINEQTLTLRQIRFCADECRKQQSGEYSVYRMCEAFYAARCMTGLISVEDIKYLGELVDERNINGFRFIPVSFSDGVVNTLTNEQLERQISLLCSSQLSLTSTRFYQEFETIHPFIDGNGRVGALLFNYLHSSLATPISPPQYKKEI